MQPRRDTKAELNRRSQVCDALAGTGVRIAQKRNGIPCWNRTSLCGFAGRRLSCSANGIIIEIGVTNRIRTGTNAVTGRDAACYIMITVREME